MERTEGSLAADVVKAIQTGDVEKLRQLLADHPTLATSRIGPRTLLHIATDWPGHFPRNGATVAALIEAGAEVDAPFSGSHQETALHWAASSDDIEVLDTLIDAGADLEAPGSVIDGGTPLADAVAFGQWNAARRLVERGAKPNLWHAAALGLVERMKEHFADAPPTPDEITNAFWCACHGGQRDAAGYLLKAGADLNWIGHDGLTSLDAAARSNASALVSWLRSLGARPASEVK